MTASIEKAVESVKNSETDEEEKIMVITAMVNLYTPIARKFFTLHASTQGIKVLESGVLGLYSLGKAIKYNFGTKEKIINLVIKPWKEAVSLQNTYYSYNYGGAQIEYYIEQIKQLDPSYTAPKVPLMKKIINIVKGILKKKN